MPFYEDNDYENYDFTKDYQDYKNLTQEFIDKYSVDKDSKMDQYSGFYTLKTLDKKVPVLLEIVKKKKILFSSFLCGFRYGYN